MRNSILASLPRTGSERPPIWKTPDTVASVERFNERFTALGGRVLDLDQARVECSDCIVDSDAEPFWGASSSSDIWAAEVGVTCAEFVIAETGSVILSASAEHRRLGSLTPPRHVVLLKRSQLVPNLESALTCLPGSTSVMITGPSRTADIEGVLVKGVHGPREIWAVWVD